MLKSSKIHPEMELQDQSFTKKKYAMTSDFQIQIPEIQIKNIA